MTLIKVEIFAGIIVAIVTVSLVWAKDFVDMKRDISLHVSQMEIRQLQADQRHINDKIRKIQ